MIDAHVHFSQNRRALTCSGLLRVPGVPASTRDYEV